MLFVKARSGARTISAGWVVLWLAVFTPAYGATSPAAYLELLNAGLSRSELGQWDIARKEFLAASQLDPDDPLAYAGQALCRLAFREDDAAASLFRLAANSGRADAVATSGLALCYFDVGQLATAETLFQKASKDDPLLFTPYFYRAVIALCENRLDAAGELLKRADELGAPTLLLRYLETMRLFAAGRWSASDQLRQLKPKLATSTPGLPLPLPLQVAGEPGEEVRFSVATGAPLSERVAPPVAVTKEPVQPAANGPLSVEFPLPGATVNGRIPIRVNLLSARDFKYVTISVDGKLKGMTNREPFYVVWDTTVEADGEHLIAVRARGLSDIDLDYQVTVQNHGAAQGNGNPYDPASYRTATRRLATLFLHSLPPISVEHLLVEAYRQQDPDLAIDMYERVLAKDPTRVDVIAPLLALYEDQGLAYSTKTIIEPRHGIPGANRVALTFDDGPRPEFTPDILKTLAKYQARATFLITGRMAERYPELVKDIVKAGHELAQHTYNHPRLDTVSAVQIAYELIKTKVVLDDLVGGSSRFFRPPGGHYNATVRDAVAPLGYFPVFWTVNGGAFTRLAPTEAAQAISKRTEDGGILLLHNGADNTLPLLPYLLEDLSRRGFRYVTVTDILRSPTDAAYLPSPAFGPLNPSELQDYAGEE